jgi:penicillin-binding protein 1A
MNKELSKEKILELYLNKIFYGSNAYGIEQAAQTFFWKSAEKLTVLEGSILTSLPKWPSYYSPYNHPDRLVGYPYIYKTETPSEQTKILTKQDITIYKTEVEKLLSIIDSLKLEKLSTESVRICWLDEKNFKKNISIDKNGCSITIYSKLLDLLNGIQITEWDKKIEYQAWRKDFILWRMLEDKYIDFDVYKSSIIWGIGIEFNKYTEKIKYSYFVLYVKEYVEKKYGTDLLESGWLKIYTTLDSKLQDKAEELVVKYGATNEKRFDAHNVWMVSIDNKTWDILTMVWGRDYFDTNNKGNINATTIPMQNGSSFKPFVYALAIDTKPIGSKTPIYDVKTSFPWYKGYPKNFDGKFMGKMNLTTALDYSRNIPALKMFYVAGWEKNIITLMKKLWVTSLKEDERYGATLAIGTGEISVLELAWAYSVFANLWYKKEVTPIKKIIDSKWLIIEEKTTKDFIWEKVFDESSSYIINTILSDTSSRPAWWNSFVSLSWRTVAAKTGTSTKNYIKNWQKTVYPRDLWTIWYTPQITTVVWAGNLDGKETNLQWDWLNAAGPIWRDFMKYAHEGKKVENWKRPVWVKSVNISSISWFLASKTLDKKFIVASLFKNVPKNYDTSLKTVKVDALCNGLVDENTPPEAIKEVFVIDFQSIDPSNKNWEGGVLDWLKWGWAQEMVGNENFVSSISNEPCKRSRTAEKVDISSNIKNWIVLNNGSNYIEFSYSSKNPLIRADIYVWENKIDSITIEKLRQGNIKRNISIPSGYYWEYNLSIKMIDDNYYSSESIYKILINQTDKTAPTINITNPSDGNIKIYQNQSFNLKANIEDSSPLKSINIYLDNTPLKIGEKERTFSYSINSNNSIPPWKHIVKVEAVDNTFNISSKEIELEILPTSSGGNTD